jgi:hypothetical protein
MLTYLSYPLLCGTGARDTGGKAIILVKNFEIVCARGGRWYSSTHFLGSFLRIVFLDWRKKFKIEGTFTCVFLEIHGIPYMKKVTEFRDFPRNFTELYDTEFGGIPPKF